MYLGGPRYPLSSLSLSFFPRASGHSYLPFSLGHLEQSTGFRTTALGISFHSQVCLASFCVFMLSHFSHIWVFATPWPVAHQTPLSMEFSRQEYWSGLPCPPPGALPDPGMELVSPMSPALSGRIFTAHTTREAQSILRCIFWSVPEMMILCAVDQRRHHIPRECSD